MGARKDLAEALDAILPATIRVHADVADVTGMSPELLASIQVIRVGLEPASEPGAWWHDWALWLYVAETDAETVDETLDDALEIVMPLLNFGDLVGLRAERDTHPSDFHAYRISCRTRGREL